jgi:hypothetical protein
MSTELRATNTATTATATSAVATAPRAGAVSAGLGATLAREVNAVFAIAWREILRAIKSPLSLSFTVIFPILFIGVLGGSISQNLGNALPFAYLPFMLIGMIANTARSRASPTSSRSVRTTSRPSSSSPPSRATPSCSASSSGRASRRSSRSSGSWP